MRNISNFDFHHNNIFRSDIVKAGDIEPLSWQKPTLSNMQQLWHMASGYSGWANPRVIFISSKLPAAEVIFYLQFI